MLTSRTEQKTEDELGEDQFGFRRGKGTRDATRMLQISDRTSDTDKELCVCFTDWQKAPDHVTWTKLMQVLEKTSSTGEKNIDQQPAHGSAC
jgi:Reverse transcriptase (RNA-dependent DNA polymerase).